jgi:hypothetical protein
MSSQKVLAVIIREPDPGGDPLLLHIITEVLLMTARSLSAWFRNFHQGNHVQLDSKAPSPTKPSLYETHAWRMANLR